MRLKFYKIACVVLIHLYLIINVAATVRQLPHCIESSNQGLVLVSTLDGKVSALNTTGSLSWQISTDPGSLLKSNIHSLQLTNNGEWIQIIPSLTGSLYKFNGKTLDAIPISADNLLKSSFVYANDIVIAGGKEIKTYGVGLHTGHILYTCSLEGCQNKTQYEGEIDDVIVIERNTLTVRAHEPRTGSERWNFSVGHHNMKIPHHECANLINTQMDFNITAVLPEGLIKAMKIEDNTFLWEQKFDAPIVDVWIWNGRDLQNVDTFGSAALVQNDVKMNPFIYLAMHNKQLYIHESQQMLEKLQQSRYSENEVIESKGVLTIPWKPVLASSSVLIQNTNDLDKSTAVSVLYGSEYVNGNGFYLYTDPNVADTEHYTCRGNLTDSGALDSTMLFLWPLQWHWTVHLTIIVSICVAYFLCNLEIKGGPECSNQNITKSVEITPNVVDTPPIFMSHYENSFETIRCLGKGGFGVVFEAKQKIDECGYAIKRITLHTEKSMMLVLREVRALATLDHKNIVRYFNSWFERPPPGYSYEHDKDVLDNDSSYPVTPVKTHKRNNSTIIDMPELCETESSGGIVFLDETKEGNKTLSNSVSFEGPNMVHLTTKHSAPFGPTTSDIHSNSTKETFAEAIPIYLYIQMQLCQAESLKEWLLENSEERNKKFALSIFKQIVDAVAYVHSKNLIHRDLKPSNIFFSLDGDIKIGDFGLVTTMNDDHDTNISSCYSPLQSHTRGVGTKLYMSPEQIDKKKYNFKVDIYSLGVILFELLVPFSTDSERIKTLTDLRQAIYPSDFSIAHKDEFELLECMLSKNPEKRPTTEEIKASLF